MKIYETKKIPIKSWCDDIETSAFEQAMNLAKLPFAKKHIALMPDCHTGYGMPIGGVIACDNAVIPNAVGVDIGCGMLAVKTSLTNITQEQLKAIMGGSKKNKGGIRSFIPLGFNHHSKKQEWEGFDSPVNIPIIKKELSSAEKQLGTLGGGNHFIEIQKGSDGHIWFMVHSGSRNFGYKIAKEYNIIAQNLCRIWYSDIPKFKGADGLAFLPIGTKEAEEYIKAMNYALSFALANREHMMKNIQKSFLDALDCTFETPINIHHNYAKLENHFGENLWIHRKGATQAYKEQIGIIPGSQGTSSYIVEGLGNIESFKSCSHGAGRKMSRKKAKEILNLEEEKALLDKQNIIHSIRHNCDLDEASGAYKNIDEVIKSQLDLIKIKVKLEPLAVIKG